MQRLLFLYCKKTVVFSIGFKDKPIRKNHISYTDADNTIYKCINYNVDFNAPKPSAKTEKNVFVFC